MYASSLYSLWCAEGTYSFTCTKVLIFWLYWYFSWRKLWRVWYFAGNILHHENTHIYVLSSCEILLQLVADAFATWQVVINILLLLQIPSSWKPVVQDPSTLQIFFDYYRIMGPPLSKEVLLTVPIQTTWNLLIWFAGNHALFNYNLYGQATFIWHSSISCPAIYLCFS